jgi:hypothetical protein
MTRQILAIINRTYSIFLCYARNLDPPKSPLKRGTLLDPPEIPPNPPLKGGRRGVRGDRYCTSSDRPSAVNLAHLSAMVLQLLKKFVRPSHTIFLNSRCRWIACKDTALPCPYPRSLSLFLKNGITQQNLRIFSDKF